MYWSKSTIFYSIYTDWKYCKLKNITEIITIIILKYSQSAVKLYQNITVAVPDTLWEPLRFVAFSE